MGKKIVVIGAGFGGLGAACLLAKAGHEVTVIEKNGQVGGRAGVFEAKGFRFDTGPSWYLMPGVFERFFGLIDEKIEDHLTLERLRPSYRVTFKDYGQQLDIYGDLVRDKKTFDAIEPGAGEKLEKYLARSKYIHDIAISKVLYKNYGSLKGFLSPGLLKEAHKLSLFSSMDKYVGKYFRDQRLRQIMEYPLLFLGTSPYSAPALYSLMNHVDFSQSVFYPKGGMYEVTKALERLARQHGVRFKLNTPVSKILVENGRSTGVVAGGKTYKADSVISNADVWHTETALLDKPQRDHSEKYWQSRTLAPSALLIYLGVDRQYDSLRHHNLVFSPDWQKNLKQIFNDPKWPDDPSFYVSATSKTDPTAAPKGQENLFVLVPIAAGLKYTNRQMEAYADKILVTMEAELKLPGLREHIVYKKLFCVKDFESQYNSFQGTALGLAHTLKQTAVFRPSNQSKKVKDLYYVGANVHPGIGLPMCLISAELVAERFK